MVAESVHVHKERLEPAPHTFGQLPDQAIEAYREGMMGTEQAEPDRVTDAARIPQPEQDLASQQAQDESVLPEDIDPDMTIGLGEDPGLAHVVVPADSPSVQEGPDHERSHAQTR